MEKIFEFIGIGVTLLFVVFCVWFATCSVVFRDKSTYEDSQSERQKTNDDYNNDYH